MHPVQLRRRITRGLDGDGGALADDEDDQDVDLLDNEGKDELRALRSDAAAPAGGMLLGGRPRHHTGHNSASAATDSVAMATTMASSATSITQPSRRLTLPSIVKYPEVSGVSLSSNTRHTGSLLFYIYKHNLML